MTSARRVDCAHCSPTADVNCTHANCTHTPQLPWDTLHAAWVKRYMSWFERLRAVLDGTFPELSVAPCATTGCPHNSSSRSQVAQHGPWHDEIDAAAPSIFQQQQ